MVPSKNKKSGEPLDSEIGTRKRHRAAHNTVETTDLTKLNSKKKVRRKQHVEEIQLNN